MLGFFHTSNVIKHDAGFRFHGKASFALAELHGLTRAAGHVVGAACQEDQGANQQQREGQIAKDPEGRWGCAGRMDIETDALLFDLADQFRGQAGQVNAQTLNAVIDVRVHGFNNRGAATVVDVNSGDSAGFEVVEETAVSHARHCAVARSFGGAVGRLHRAAAAHHLQSKEDNQGDGQGPKRDQSPAVVHRKLPRATKNVSRL